MTLAPGTRLGPYEIVSPIGAGGMGEVYRASDSRLGRDVAIKVLPASFSKDSDRLKRFEQEARAAGVLNHPNVTIVYDIGFHDGAPYVVQELLEGRTLRDELGRGRLSQRQAIDYAIQIAHGLAAAHEKGIIHRDLKPENVFVTRDGRIKILDFGLAKLIEVKGSARGSQLPTATEPGIVMGTLGYISPEQIKTEPADGRSDIFALGVILHEMLSGRRPFQGDTAAETMAAILKEDPPELRLTNQNVSPALDRLVRHCLEKNPERRFQSARDLAFDLETITGVSGSLLPPSKARAGATAWRKTLLAAGLIGTGALAAWAWSAVRSAPSAMPSYRRLTFRRGTVYTARFAADGQTVVYSAAWEGEPARIFATRAGSVQSRSLQLPDARVLAVSTTGDLAICLGRETTWTSTGTLAVVPLEGGAPRELLENVSAADWTPDGRDLAVVHKVGGKDRLEFPIGKVLFESGAAIESVRFSPRGDRLAIVMDEPTLAIVLVDLAGKATTLSKGWKGVGDWVSLGNVAWRSDGNEIWFSGQRPSEKFALYAVTPSGRQRVLRREAGGLYLHDLSKDGRALVNDYFWNSSLVGVTAGDGKEHELSWMDQPYVNAISNDGRTVVFDEWGEGRGSSESIYIRAMDGSPAVHVGDGHGLALSPDGRWILSLPSYSAEAFVLLPTGPGQPRSVPHRGVTSAHFARFFPDGQKFLFNGIAGSGSWRVYVQSLDGAEPHATSIQTSLMNSAISPDGHFVAAPGPDSKIAIYPIDRGTPRPLPGAEAGESAILWSSEGSLYTYRTNETPARVFKIDMPTGQREIWKTITPADRSGLIAIDSIVMAPDARSYAYSYQRILTSLELLQGLR
jgi:Tol biopolymer transport system component